VPVTDNPNKNNINADPIANVDKHGPSTSKDQCSKSMANSSVSLASTVTLYNSQESIMADDKNNSNPQVVQFPITESFKNMLSLRKGGRKYKEITDAILIMICKDNLPLMIVENVGFKHLLHVTAPQYKVPTRKTIAQLLDSKYDVISTLFKEKLSEIPYFTLTTDIWTESNQTQSFLGITVHFLKNTAMSSSTIGAFPMEERHTSAYISELLTKACQEWHIPQTKILSIVTDNGANMVKACVDTFGKNRHIRCFAHTLNLVPEQSFEKSPEVKLILDKVRKIVKWFKQAGADELRKVQISNGISEGAVLKLKQDVQTRWNSTYHMIDRFIELSNYVNNILLNSTTGPDTIMASEMKILKEIKQLLKPLEIATREMSGEKYATLSKVIPIVHGINHQIQLISINEHVSKDFQNMLMSEMKKRFEQIELVSNLAVATLLDLRFKKIHFKNYNAVAMAVKLIKNEMTSGMDPITEQNSSITQEVTQENHNDDEGDIWSHHKILVQQINPAGVDLQTLVSTEISQYLSAPLCPLQDDPFQKWEQIKISLPRLYLVAQKFLQIPATSVPSERLFSKAGNIMNERRNRLLGKRLHKLLFLGSLNIEEWK
jgi:hypothetical protein